MAALTPAQVPGGPGMLVISRCRSPPPRPSRKQADQEHHGPGIAVPPESRSGPGRRPAAAAAQHPADRPGIRPRP